MKGSIKLFILGIFLAGFLAILAKPASANEGTFTMASNDGAQCQGFSVEVLAGKYSILVRCVNLTYPPSSSSTYYYVWSAMNDEKPQRLGDLNLGRAGFTAMDPYNKVLVSIEQKKNPMNPSSEIVMTGNLQSFVFNGVPLEEIAEPTAAPSEKDTTEQTQEQSSLLAKITSFLLRAGVIVLIVVAVGGAIYYIISKFK